MQGRCSPEQRAQCPLARHFEDTHHLYFPARDFKSRVEKNWRELPENKVNICRGLHNSIHASGYLPLKPSRGEMLADLASDTASAESRHELSTQLLIGRLMSEGAA